MFIIVEDISQTMAKLLAQEDTDGDKKITILDKGPKIFSISTSENSTYEIKGTYRLSNFLQEMAIELKNGKSSAKIPIWKIEEAPADRISRMIKEYYWDGLTRTLDEKGIKDLIKDSKNQSLLVDFLRIYVPFNDDFSFQYFKNLEPKFPIKVEKLPEDISPEYVKSINNSPGILSLKLNNTPKGIEGEPFVVPGGRFNEMYGWDSYFESIGLIIDGKVDLALSMANNFKYEIEHYGKILNANRSYFLTRTQPPFYSSLVKEVYNVTQDKEWLKSHLPVIIHEYESVWMKEGKRLSDIGLNKYHAEGLKMTPETEEGHYDCIIAPYAEKENISIQKFEEEYQSGKIQNKELDNYFFNDRTVRESGHDTSYRIEDKCGHQCLVELNSMLYKYECDLAQMIEEEFDNHFEAKGKVYNSDYFRDLAKKRKTLVNSYMWNEEEGFYFDYNLQTAKQETYVSATSVFPLWAGLATEEQAQRVVKKMMAELKEKGGIVSGTEKSRGEISATRPARQWDYPFGWPPHQIIIWKALKQWGFDEELNELVYRWLYMITKNAADFNGTIPEKYDVVEATHLVFVEYGNVGVDFDYITQEGFGWMNASFQFGLQLLAQDLIFNLNDLVEPHKLFP